MNDYIKQAQDAATAFGATTVCCGTSTPLGATTVCWAAGATGAAAIGLFTLFLM